MPILCVIANDNDSVKSLTPSGKEVIVKKIKGNVQPDDIVSVLLRTYTFFDFRKPSFKLPKKVYFLENKSVTAGPGMFELTKYMLQQAAEVELLKSTDNKNEIEPDITSEQWDAMVAMEEEIFPATDSLQCIVCRKPLMKGNLRCSACKAVLYCSKTCQKKDWQSGHKMNCQNFKKIMNQVPALYDLPFSYFNPRTQLRFVGCRDLIILERGVIEEGLYNCYHYDHDPNVNEGHYGEFGFKLFESYKDKSAEEKCEAYGVPECAAMFKPTQDGFVKSWEDVLNRYQISNKSISPLLMSNVLTLGYIIKNQLSDPSEKKLIHLIGCDIEADIFPLYETLLYLFPKAGLNVEIHMYGPLISKQNNNKEATLTKNENTIKVKAISSTYNEKFIKENPDLLVALNPGFFLDTLWKSTMPVIFENKPKDLKFIIAERDENTIQSLEKYTQFHQINALQLSEINPFREPYVDYIMGMMIPCVKNSFFFVL